MQHVRCMAAKHECVYLGVGQCLQLVISWKLPGNDHFGPFWLSNGQKKDPHQVFKNYKMVVCRVHVLHQMSAKWCHPTASRLAKTKHRGS
jgi:hypothetical protein